MGDIKMNEFAPVADAMYIYGELSDGRQVKIRKLDLLNGLFQNNGGIIDANTIKSNGIYRGRDTSINTPSTYGILLCFTSEGYVWHLYIDAVSSTIYSRISPDNGVSWRIWKTISIT
ncbi:pyocin knob domain-containing protein [Bacteroides sp.]|uniref:pyocin knob domain-containing protein n=1 Tax=Bacteroides sp. TaxID=29523 RepID=UPI002614E3D5|nr:pyocin knob domain-containing protein [Bacteroides sp.]